MNDEQRRVDESMKRKGLHPIHKTLFIPDETIDVPFPEFRKGLRHEDYLEESPVEPRREPTFARKVFGTGEAPTSLGKALGRLGWLLLALILWTIIGLIIYQTETPADSFEGGLDPTWFGPPAEVWNEAAGEWYAVPAGPLVEHCYEGPV